MTAQKTNIHNEDKMGKLYVRIATSNRGPNGFVHPNRVSVSVSTNLSKEIQNPRLAS